MTTTALFVHGTPAFLSNAVYFLQKAGEHFSAINPALFNKIDFAKSRNEIPLIDTLTGKVFYGIDSLLEILDQKIPLIKKIGNFLPLK